MKGFIKITCVVSLLVNLCAVEALWASEYYVSTTGNDSTGDGSLTHPWRNPHYAASQMTTPGDVLHLRGGTYDVPTTSVIMAAAICPRADGCTIRAYDGETVVLRGNGGQAPTNGVIGSFNGSSGVNNLTLDGLTIQGIVVAMLSGMTIQNCDISVGSDSWSGIGQGEVIWVQAAQNVTVRNCRLHDNTTGAQSGTIQNNGLIMCYVVNGLLVEHCDIFNSVGTGITMKDDVQNAVIRFNHIHTNAAAGIWTGNNTANPYPKSGEIYQNVFCNNNTTRNAEMGAVSLVIYTSLLDIYNNTFYGNYVADLLQWVGGSLSVPFTFWNNLSANPRNAHLSWPYGGSEFTATYMNYNGYSGPGDWVYRGARYSTLQAWQAQANSLLSGSESASVSTDPGFLNASGTFSVPADFKRSSYPQNGRGGAYLPVMGAYVTGQETIGYSPEGDLPSDTTPPDPPTGLGVQVVP